MAKKPTVVELPQPNTDDAQEVLAQFAEDCKTNGITELFLVGSSARGGFVIRTHIKFPEITRVVGLVEATKTSLIYDYLDPDA